ncbi:MAG TPA: dihydroorotase [Cyclobacteriaceae bacterium]
MSYIIKNAQIVNDNQIIPCDILIKDQRIEKIGSEIDNPNGYLEIDASAKYVIPGLIDDQVHFREPGLTHKAEIYTEAKAAVAGGITSYMEMPNTVPNTLTQPLLEDKYELASKKSLANYSFYMGASNDNIQEVLKTDPKRVCGVKIFMGASTGDMLVDETKALEAFFSKVQLLIATHCEDEGIIKYNMEQFKNEYGEDIPFDAHPKIRSREACLKSSSKAVEMAKRYGTRLHILHISTAEEVELFDNILPLKEKKITSEACTHHLWFEDSDYKTHGSRIKWNPAVKTRSDKEAILKAVLSDRIDVLATDHAPHSLSEKQNKYLKAPSGGPLVQHALPVLLELYHQGMITLEKIVEKACHNPAIMFDVKDRGYIREGYYADLVIIDLNRPWNVTKENILYKCGWSPLEGQKFQSSIVKTFVSGHLVYSEGKFDESTKGMRLLFDR